MIEPFRVEVADAMLDDLRRRLEHTRLPDEIDGTGWEYGIPIGYLRELVQYWRDEYDWLSDHDLLLFHRVRARGWTVARRDTRAKRETPGG